MNAKLLLAAAITASSAALFAFAPRATEAPAAPAAASTYTVDGVHSFCTFRCKHLNTSFAYGRFDKISGTISFDEAAPTSSSIEIEVNTDSISTGNGKRDGDLKNAGFLSASEYPKATFKSKSFKKAGENTFDVTGEFTLRGVTKEITVKLEKTGAGKGMGGGEIVGFETTFTIDRMDYGAKAMDAQLGHEVRLTVAMEAGKK